MPGAFAIVIVTLSAKSGSSDAVAGSKPGTFSGRKAMEYYFFFPGMLAGQHSRKEENKK